MLLGVILMFLRRRLRSQRKIEELGVTTNAPLSPLPPSDGRERPRRAVLHLSVFTCPHFCALVCSYQCWPRRPEVVLGWNAEDLDPAASFRPHFPSTGLWALRMERRFVVVGDKGAILTSTNGQGGFKEVARRRSLMTSPYGGGTFVAVGRAGTIVVQ